VEWVGGGVPYEFNSYLFAREKSLLIRIFFLLLFFLSRFRAILASAYLEIESPIHKNDMDCLRLKIFQFFSFLQIRKFSTLLT